MDAWQRGDTDRDEEDAALLTQPDQQTAQQQSLSLRVLGWALGLAVIGVTAYSSWQIWLAWQTGYEPYWQQAWTAVPVVFFLAIAYLMSSLMGRFLLGLRAFIRLFRAQNERVRQAAITGNDRLAPLAAEQPEPLPSSEWPLSPAIFGPFEPQRQKAVRRSLVTGGATFLVAGGMIALIIVIGGILPTTGDGLFGGMIKALAVIWLGLIALFGLVSLAGLIVLLWGRVRSSRQDLPERFVVDDWSLRQDGGGNRRAGQPLAWHDIRAFYKADDLLRLNGSLVSEGPPQRTTYTVEAGERRLQWSIGNTSTPAQRAESDWLVRLVVTRTRLPLRDLSAAVSSQALAMMDLIATFDRPFSGKRFTVQSSPDSAASHPSIRSLGTRQSRWLSASRIAAFALALLLLGAGALVQTIQTFEYEDLLHQHITREIPYYAIDFRQDDGRWPERPVTSTSGSFAFSKDGYYMTGAPDGQPMEALLTDTYSDATIELTAGLTGMAPPSDYGVALRESDDGTAKVVFSVSSSGGWALTSYQADTSGVAQPTVLMRNDHSDAVEKGQNANNFMTVIARGSDYLCFVRDHIVGIYHDLSGQTPRQGHSGIWLGNSRAVGIYYYFTIYPAQ